MQLYLKYVTEIILFFVNKITLNNIINVYIILYILLQTAPLSTDI